MIKELSTMALVAVLSTNISNHFGTVMGAATEIAGVYQTAQTSQTPDEFVRASAVQVKRLANVAGKVQHLQLTESYGPFGVPVIAAR